MNVFFVFRWKCFCKFCNDRLSRNTSDWNFGPPRKAEDRHIRDIFSLKWGVCKCSGCVKWRQYVYRTKNSKWLRRIMSLPVVFLNIPYRYPHFILCIAYGVTNGLTVWLSVCMADWLTDSLMEWLIELGLYLQLVVYGKAYTQKSSNHSWPNTCALRAIKVCL